jgi:hypothetical protein
MAARLGVRRCTPGAAVHGPGAAIQATLSAAHLATATTDHPGLSGRMDQPPGPVSGPTMTTDLTLDPEVPCVGAEPAWAEGGSGQVAGGRDWPRMPSGRGGTTPGSSLVTRRSGPRPPECWTCTRASSTAGPSVKTSTSSAPMRRPASRRAAAATPPCRRAGRAACASSTSMSAAARWLIWPPGTSTTPACSAAANPPPASPPFGHLVAQVMTTESYASARRVF